MQRPDVVSRPKVRMPTARPLPPRLRGRVISDKAFRRHRAKP